MNGVDGVATAMGRWDIGDTMDPLEAAGEAGDPPDATGEEVDAYGAGGVATPAGLREIGDTIDGPDEGVDPSRGAVGAVADDAAGVTGPATW